MPIVEFNNNNMSTRTKFILTFVAGLVTGVILVFAFGYYVAMSNRNNSSSDNVVQMFDTPKQEIKADEFKIFQVLPDGSALASYDEIISKEGYIEYGTVVFFPASNEAAYYDSQIITLPKGKCFKQIGTYRYTTKDGMMKTVPAIDIFDK